MTTDAHADAFFAARAAENEDFWASLMPEAAAAVIEHQRASRPFLGRQMRLGLQHDGALIDELLFELHELGVVGPLHEGQGDEAKRLGERDVLVELDGLDEVLAEITRIATTPDEDDPTDLDNLAPPPVDDAAPAGPPPPGASQADQPGDQPPAGGQPGGVVSLAKPHQPTCQPGASLAIRQPTTLAPATSPHRPARQVIRATVHQVAARPGVTRTWAVSRQVLPAGRRLVKASPHGARRTAKLLYGWLVDTTSPKLLAKLSEAVEGDQYSKVAHASTELHAKLVARRWLVATLVSLATMYGLALWAPAGFASVLASLVGVGVAALAPRRQLGEWLAWLAVAGVAGGVAWCFGDDLAGLVPRTPVWPWWVWLVVGGTTVLALGLAGWKGDQPPLIEMPAGPLVHQAPPLTAHMVRDALCRIGIAAIKDPDQIRVLQDAHRNGPGVQVDLELPTAAAEVIAQRERLAAVLLRELGCVWPEVGRLHAAHLSLYVSDQPMSQQDQDPWPLAAATRPIDVFEKQPMFTTKIGKWMLICPMFVSILIGAVPRVGKALALGTPVPTPNGWTTMGELRDGDEVFDEQGHPCRVVAAHPVRHDRPCYRVAFSDGSVIVADADHLWQVETRSGRVHGRPEKVLTTGEMLGSVRVEADQRVNYSIRVAGALQLPDAELPIPPYTLGAWLGDGTAVHGALTVGVGDEATLDEIRADGYIVTERPSARESGRAPYYGVGGLRAQLRDAGLLGNKRIPPVYFRASEQQRHALLAGLLDTDGWVQNASTVMFGSMSRDLAEDVRQLVATLGYASKLSGKNVKVKGREYGTFWQVTFCPDRPVFRLARKVERHTPGVKASNSRRFITAIEPVPSVPVRCVTVDSPSSLYLVGEQCIPTHNTFILRQIGLIFALDIRSRLYLLDGKGMGDLNPLKSCAHFISRGGTPEEVEGRVLPMLRELRQELYRRAKVVNDLPDEEVPESKVTTQLADRRELGLYPVFLGMDETQTYYLYGSDTSKNDKAVRAEIIEITTELAKLGPACGFVFVGATQNICGETVPRQISLTAMLRIALKVVDSTANNKILGDGAYGRGIDATAFDRTDLGVAWVAGEGDVPEIGRSVFGLDAPTVRRLAERAAGWRKAAGLLTGQAAGEDDIEDAEIVYNKVQDAERMMAERGCGGAQWGELVGWLRELRAQYIRLTEKELSASMRAAGVPVKDIRSGDTVRKGVYISDLRKCLRGDDG